MVLAEEGTSLLLPYIWPNYKESKEEYSGDEKDPLPAPNFELCGGDFVSWEIWRDTKSLSHAPQPAMPPGSSRAGDGPGKTLAFGCHLFRTLMVSPPSI